LVPRASSTPVAAWSWPTWVVESETCVGSRVHLVGEEFLLAPIHSPLSGLPFRSFNGHMPITFLGSFLTLDR
jgi:hypothetical protein